MKAYIRKNHDGQAFDRHMYAAYAGFRERCEVQWYTTIHAVKEVATDDVIVGTYTDIRDWLETRRIEIPNLDYPEELREFLGRKLWQSTLFTVTNDVDAWHVFVKPVSEGHRFRGTTLDETDDLIKLGGLVTDIAIWCSEKVQFLSEWRVYVVDGVAVGMNFYAGDWQILPDTETIRAAIAAYRSAPRGYAVDFGVDAQGRTLLVEVNDGFGLSNYGLLPQLYAELLAARWTEMVAPAMVTEADTAADTAAVTEDV